MRRQDSKLAVFLAFFLLAGCASRRIARDQIPQEQRERFWNGCTKTTPAIADGFQHFTCTDVQKKIYEVLIRKEPKK